MQLMKLKLGAVTYLGYDFSVKGNEIRYKSENGNERILYINGCAFSFESVQRDWTVVIGTASGNFWAQREIELLEGMEVLVQDNLTEEEAKELASELEKTRDEYKF